MALIDKVVQYDTAVYWSPLSLDDHGMRTHNTPIEINVRWTDKMEQIKKPNGEITMSNAMVMTDRDVEVGGILLHGELDSSIDDSPRSNSGAYEIVQFAKIPNKRNTKFVRKAYL